MARIRAIKPEFFTSETIASLPIHCRLTFIGLWTHADDYGRAVDNPRIIKGAIWPLDDEVTPTDVSLHIHLLEERGLIARYEVDGRRYLHAVKWTSHQKVSHPQEARIPACPLHEALPKYSGGTPEPHQSEAGAAPEPFRPSRAPAEQGAGKGAGKGAGSREQGRADSLRSSRPSEQGNLAVDPATHQAPPQPVDTPAPRTDPTAMPDDFREQVAAARRASA